jgi:apolipoprotein N-acyltransferase
LRLSQYRFSGVAALGGATFALAAPPTDVYPGVWLGLSGLYLATVDAPTGRRAALRAWLWATSAGVVGMAFIPEVIERFTPVGFAGGVVALVLLSAFQALAWAAGAALAHVLDRRGLIAQPIAFGAAVLLAISLPTVIAWSPASVLSPWPAFLQLADVIGERGVSFLLAVSAALVAMPLRSLLAGTSPIRPWRAPLIGALLIAALGIHGAFRIAQIRRESASLPTLRVGVVQAAVPARLRWDPSARGEIIRRLRRLTTDSERLGAELTLWPEAAYPYTLPHAAGTTPDDARRIVGGGVRGPVLIGLITSAREEQGRHNSATLVSPDGEMQEPQAKLALLWFGETIPLSEYLPFLRRLFFRAGGLVPGDQVVLLELRPARIGVLNCYEDTLPAVGRRIARAEPNLLVNVTNDAWFGPTSEPELHLRVAVLRTIETRLDLVRAVNLGVPAWIDRSGSVRTRGSDDEQSVMLVTPSLNDSSPTLYVSVGDVPVWLGLFLAAAGGAVRARRQRRRDAT